MANGWGVFNLSGELVFDVDSVLDLKVSGKAKVSDFPVEEGAFSSYNKVKEPKSSKVRLAVGGTARIGTFQAALDTELGSANLYNIVTPTTVYLNVTLESYDYSQAAESGLNLLVVDMSFKEIREVSPAYSTVAHPKNPASASKKVNGKAAPQTPPGPPPPPWSTLMADAEKASL